MANTEEIVIKLQSIKKDLSNELKYVKSRNDLSPDIKNTLNQIGSNLTELYTHIKMINQTKITDFWGYYMNNNSQHNNINESNSLYLDRNYTFTELISRFNLTSSIYTN